MVPESARRTSISDEIGVSPLFTDELEEFWTKAGPWLEIAAGCTFMGLGLRSRSFEGGVLALVGGVILARRASSLYAGCQFDCLSTASDRSRESQRTRGPNLPVGEYPHTAGRTSGVINDRAVDEASWESFPASDAPAWGGSTTPPGSA